jgi:hypothetical protein
MIPEAKVSASQPFDAEEFGQSKKSSAQSLHQAAGGGDAWHGCGSAFRNAG